MSENKRYSGIIAWFTYNPVAANLLMIFILILGLHSFLNIRKALTPEFRTSAVAISAVYPGASPEEVENGVVLKIEEAIKEKNIIGIDRIDSVSRESLGQVTVQVLDGIDIDDLSNELKAAVDGISTFPNDVESPTIEKIIQSIPVLNIQISSDHFDEMAAKDLANDIKTYLLANGASKIIIYGEREIEINVEVSENTLRKYNLTLHQIAQAISRSSVDVPAGSIRSDKGDLLLRASGKAYKEKEFAQIPIISTADGKRLLLGDIANITRSFEESTTRNAFDGKQSIGLGLFAVGDEDIIELSDVARKYLDDLDQSLPEGLNVKYWGETVGYLQGRLDLMYDNLLMGALLVILILSLFMNFSIAFWVMLGLPVCFLGAFFMLPYADVTINMISLFGFILVLGIVVDDAIIIGESAHSYMRQENSHSIETIIRGVRRVSTPAIFGVLTTICAFLPTIMVTGKWANFPAACGYVVFFCLVFSMIESKLILPAHLAHSSESSVLDFKWQNNLQLKMNEKLDHFVADKYTPFMEKALRLRYIVVAVFVAMLMIIFTMLSTGMVRYVFQPDVPSDFIRASFSLPRGTSELKVQQSMQQISDSLKRVEQEYMETFNTDASFVKHRFEFYRDTEGRMTLELEDNKHRSIGSKEVVRRWKKEVGEIIGAKTLEFSDAQDDDVGIASDIAFNLSANNEDELYAAAAELASRLEEYPGVTSVSDGIPENMDEVQLHIKPSAQAIGLSLASIGQQVREAFYGAEALRLQDGRDEIKVKVRYPVEERKSLSNLHELYVRTDDGRGSPITSVADLDVEPSYVKRTRINGLHALDVTAKVDKSTAEPKKITLDITDKVMPELKKKYPGLKSDLSGGAKDDSQMESQLILGFLLSMVGIYALLAIPLKSYVQPIIIMSVIPFGIIGAIVGHMILGMAVSMMSIFGIIALSGVVVNDSLIMVDFINDARKKGLNIYQAVLRSGAQRFRAILLTSLTTFFGILPILLETSVQAQFVIPMAASLGFGIVFATTITLIMVPCLYLILNDSGNILKRILGRPISDPLQPETANA